MLKCISSSHAARIFGESIDFSRMLESQCADIRWQVAVSIRLGRMSYLPKVHEFSLDTSLLAGAVLQQHWTEIYEPVKETYFAW